MQAPPTRLSDWPWVVVRVDCKLCPRNGCYRLARLAQQFGAEMELERLIAVLARDCPYWRNDPRPYEVRCGARLTDWDGGQPKLDMPPRSKRLEPSRGDRILTTADLSGPTVTIVCTPCRRRGVLRVDRLRARFGDDLPLPTLLFRVAAGCASAAEKTPRCHAVYEDLRVGP